MYVKLVIHRESAKTPVHLASFFHRCVLTSPLLTLDRPFAKRVVYKLYQVTMRELANFRQYPSNLDRVGSQRRGEGEGDRTRVCSCRS